MPRTTRRRFLRWTIAGSLALLMLVGAPPAFASHTVALAHVPPPAAVHGQNVDVTSVVGSTCREGFLITCGGIGVTVRYVAPGGTIKSVSKAVANGPAQAVTVTIPGADVSGPTLTYSVTASQQSCAGLFTITCETTSARSPVVGDHTVVVA